MIDVGERASGDESAGTGPERRWVAVVTLVFLTVSALVLHVYSRLDPPAAPAAAASMGIWLAVFTLACLGPGALVWRIATGESWVSPDGFVVSLAAGAGALAAAAGALALAGLFRPAPLLIVLVGAFLWGCFRLWERREHLADLRPPRPGLVGILIILAGLTAFLAAATPSTFYDQLIYHLGFPSQWLRFGRILTYSREVYSYFPANMGILYAYALAGPGMTAAQGIHWWMGALALGSIARLAQRTFGVGTAGWAVAVFVTTPSVLRMMTWAGSDLGVAAYGLAGLVMIVRAQDAGEVRERRLAWLLAGALGGLAIGCKYIALVTVVLPAAAAMLLAALADARRAGAFRIHATRVLLWGAGVVLAFAPWAARNLYQTGNPVFPFFDNVLSIGSGVNEPEESAELADKLTPAKRRPATIGEILTLGTFAPRGEAGAIGPSYLALIPVWLLTTLLIRRGRREGQLVVAFLAGVAGWCLVPPLGRYLVPVLAIAAAGAGASWGLLVSMWPHRTATALRVLGGCVLLPWAIQTGITPQLITQIGCTFQRASLDESLSRYISYWPAVGWINERLPPRARLLLVGESRTFFLDRDLIFEDPFRTPLLVELAEKSSSVDDLAQRVGATGATHLMFNRHEAARIARMNGWSEYFATATPAARARIDAFFHQCAILLESAGPVEVYELRGCFNNP